MSEQPYLSVVIPVYNEEKRIKNLVTIISYLKNRKFSWELIVVNDGSKDMTLELLKKMKNSIKIISYDINMGKGYAIKQGMLAAKGKYLLFTDVDLSTPFEEFEKFHPYFGKYDVIIGSRKMKSANLLVRQHLIRESLGKGFTFLTRSILGIPLSDFTCGYKCFSNRCAKDIFAKQRINRWGFDAEILYICIHKGYSVVEVPVKWVNDFRSKVKFPQDITNSLKELITVKVNSARGYYN